MAKKTNKHTEPKEFPTRAEVQIITDFSLQPVRIDKRWRVMWSIGHVVAARRVLARWNAFAAKEAEGIDKTSRYYRSDKHAQRTIEAFKKKEDALANKRRGTSGTAET